MSQFNHMNDVPDQKEVCSECGKKFKVTVMDSSRYGGHESEPVYCPWCNAYNGKIHGGDSLTIFVSK
ncbi:hypothetical protein [Lactococcus garvieae]|uniref:hypothetical protein n=1 Tax=Lactococcus garvieae TaxID=1363 RepID=UPI0023EBFF9C|nr:hypothetical protein [Lactococcus garvieae]